MTGQETRSVKTEEELDK